MQNEIIYRPKVLFLASWYPDYEKPISGIFIERHANAASLFTDIAVLHVTYIPSLDKLIVNFEYEKNILIFRVYLPLDLTSFIIIRNIKNRIINNFYWQSFLAYREITKKFGRPDIIQVNVMCTDMTDLGFFAMLIRYLFGIPYIIVEHSSVYLSPINDVIKKMKTRLVIKKSSMVVAVSNTLKSSLESIQKGNFLIIPNVVDSQFFIPHNKGYNKKGHKILHVSLLDDSIKKVSEIIKAVSIIRSNREDIELHIVGNGIDREKLEGLAKKFQTEKRYIFFHGTLSGEALLNIYQQSDFFILNSERETFGCVIIEAISCGLPVIATKCGGPEDIINQYNGILINVGNELELIEAIYWMLDNREKFNPQKMHDYVENKYGYQRIGELFRDNYLIVIKKGL